MITIANHLGIDKPKDRIRIRRLLFRMEGDRDVIRIASKGLFPQWDIRTDFDRSMLSAIIADTIEGAEVRLTTIDSVGEVRSTYIPEPPMPDDRPAVIVNLNTKLALLEKLAGMLSPEYGDPLIHIRGDLQRAAGLTPPAPE